MQAKKTITNPFFDLSKFELFLWICSVVFVTLSFLLVPTKDYLTLIASLIGVTVLIFVAKGYVLGQILTVVFAVFYGIISFYFQYYGEMITYLCMTSPIAIMSVISWLRHPYGDSSEVTVQRMTNRQTRKMCIYTILVTIIFFYILKALNTANLLFSTISVATSFLASYMSMMRSPYYALGYSANDIVLIILWILATLETPSYFPMIICFFMFLINDIYGFINWRRMENRQKSTYILPQS